VFGCAVEIIDFGRIDFVELILIKSKLNLKWFMFGYLKKKKGSCMKNVVWMFWVRITFKCVKDQNGF